MYQQIIKLPFFKTKNDFVVYLNEYKYLSLKGVQLNSDLRDQILFNEGILIQKRIIKKNTEILERILVIEPHLDDFALSASSYALNAMPCGASITVLNIFSKTSVTNFPWRQKITISNKQYEKLRIQESLIAVEQYLGEKFESFRLSSPTLSGHIETYQEKYNQDELINNLTKRLIKKIRKEKISTVLCPMAVRYHVDHSITFEAVLKTYKLLKQSFKLIIYEDMPYARDKTAYFSRLKQIKKNITTEDIYISNEEYLEIIADLIIIYRSQFDDVNRQQMLAIIKEDFRATSSNKRADSKKMEFSQHYFKVKSLK